MPPRPQPEAAAREHINALLFAAGWVIQDYRAFNPTAARGIALRDEDLPFAATDLDRSVVFPSHGAAAEKEQPKVDPQGERRCANQIRTVLTAYRDALGTDLFPGRTLVPKTLIFAKDDSQAEDIVFIVREVFGRGNDFAKKITYKSYNRPVKTYLSVSTRLTMCSQFECHSNG